MKRQLQQFNYSNENSLNPKKQCSNRGKFVWTEDLNITLLTIENDIHYQLLKKPQLHFKENIQTFDTSINELTINKIKI
jgi:hypothetical protein